MSLKVIFVALLLAIVSQSVLENVHPVIVT